MKKIRNIALTLLVLGIIGYSTYQGAMYEIQHNLYGIHGI